MRKEINPYNLDVLDPAKEDGFYLLKKDSQRRTTLVRIMKDDKHNICATWHSLLLKVNKYIKDANSFNQIFSKDVTDSCITIHHLATLMDGLKGYIPEQNQQLNVLKYTIVIITVLVKNLFGGSF